jgi:hypothetical protein
MVQWLRWHRSTVAMSGTVTAADGRDNNCSGVALQIRGSVRVMPQNSEGDELEPAGCLTERVAWRRCVNVERWCQWIDGGADCSSSCAWLGGFARTCSRGRRGR